MFAIVALLKEEIYVKKISSAVFAVLFASLAIAQVDIRMDTQVADVLSIGTNVVLSSKAPASTYFVVNRVMSQGCWD